MPTSRRSDRWSATAVAVAALIVLGQAWAVAVQGVTPTPTATPTATPVPTETVAPPEIDCDLAFAEVEGDARVLPGESIRVRFGGFAPNASITLVWVDIDLPEQPLGSATAGADGSGAADVLVPRDAPMREARVNVHSVTCGTSADIVVLGSSDSVEIDDSTLAPGQLVAVTTGGFGPNEGAALSIDRAPTQGECFPRACTFLAFGETSPVGAVTLRGRIPSDTQPGLHRLWVTSTEIEGISDDYRSISIRVVAGTLPPTDTAPKR